MSLAVEVAGFGLCQITSPYSLLVICVQQESFQAWTVYRRYDNFLSLLEQLRILHPSVPNVPAFNPNNLAISNLDGLRFAMDSWLRFIASDPMILRTQAMYQFLCVDANMPPPYLEIHWRNSMNGSFDEMDMNEMFEKQLDELDTDDDKLDEVGGINGEWDEEEELTGPSDEDSLFESFEDPQDQSILNHRIQNQNQRQFHGPSAAQHANNTHAYHQGNQLSRFQQSQTTPDDDDQLDIQSVSAVKAEFMYRRLTDGNTSSVPTDRRFLSLDAFSIIKVIGKGSFGKVFLVRDKAKRSLHALKVLKKDYIIRKNQVEHTKTERSVLGYVQHPFIVGLSMAFQTTDKLFFVLDYCAGGELFFHLGKVGRFTEDRAKFYASQITLALEYVHGLDIIYRDLKPENVLLDHHGNVRLTDFGLSKEGVRDHSSGATSFCGTPEYIAPEVLLRQGHGRAVDWWSLGALLYEMITGLPPFYSRNREAMFEKIMRADLSFPDFMSESARTLLSLLLQRDPRLRLGSGDQDATELKTHEFFIDTDFEGLMAGRIIPPWTPTVVGSMDTSQFDLEFTSMLPVVSPDASDLHAHMGSEEKTFQGFSFVNDSAPLHSMMSAVRSSQAQSMLTANS